MKHTLLRSLMLLAAVIFGFSATFASTNTTYDPCALQPEGVTVSASDLLTKVYGLIPVSLDETTMTGEASNLGLMPVADEGGLWLDSSEGYRLAYAGIAPEVSARAEYADGVLAGFTYYFLFPYDCDRTRELANLDQCRFCGSLLQELNDMGADMGASVDDPSLLLDAAGSYADSQVEVQLLDEENRFVLILAVTPYTTNPADLLLASAE